MSRWYLLGVCWFCFGPGLLNAQNAQTIVYPVQAVRASFLVESLASVFPDADVTAQAEGRIVLIRAEASSCGEIVRVLELLDRPERSIVIHAYLLMSHGVPLTPEETTGLSGERNPERDDDPGEQPGDRAR